MVDEIQDPPAVQSSKPIVIRRLLAASLIVLMLLFAAALLFPARSISTEAARRNACVNRMRMLQIAMREYHDAYDCFPPAFVADTAGKPIHSWRVLLLPFLGHRALYEKYDFSEPWNGPGNIQLANQMPTDFACPSDGSTENETNYVAVVGPGTAWPEDRATTKSDIQDSDDETIMLVEVTNSGINWLAPRDMPLDQALHGVNSVGKGLAISSKHRSGANAVFCDAHSRLLLNGLPPDVLHSLLTISGHERIESDALEWRDEVHGQPSAPPGDEFEKPQRGAVRPPGAQPLVTRTAD
jgi:prepilin-type processing-associated H-X9-DG protein